MKIVNVKFERVRDCPCWAEGECLHPDSEEQYLCYSDELACPPKGCPAPDEPTSELAELGTTPNKQSDVIPDGFSLQCESCGEHFNSSVSAADHYEECHR